MKRASTVVFLACVILATLATAALAATGSTWASTVVPASDTPHTGYTLTSVKCAVCHAVHGANNTGEVLLRSSVDDACTYCHIDGNVTTNIVYSGVTENYTTDWARSHNSDGSATCVGCHRVHGADAITGGGLTEKILADLTPQVGNPWDLTGTGTREDFKSAFCSSCHPYYVGVYDDGVPISHIMTDSLTADYANTGNSAGNYAGAIAYATDIFCRDCHDAGGQDEEAGTHTDNFPHYTAGLRFLEAATSTVAPSSYAATQSANIDGVCLKCHTDGTNGIGIDF